MIIYKAEVINDDGDWRGAYGHHICYAASEEVANIEAIKYMNEHYPGFDWKAEKEYITSKSDIYYSTTWYIIKAVEVKE